MTPSHICGWNISTIWVMDNVPTVCNVLVCMHDVVYMLPSRMIYVNYVEGYCLYVPVMPWNEVKGWYQ